MDALLRDLKHSAHMLLRAPGFALTAVATLALAIASNAAIFSVVNTIWKPLPYRDPERIVMFQNILPAGRFGSASPTEFNWWLQQTQEFEDISAYDFSTANWATSLPEQVPPLMHASAHFFLLCSAISIPARAIPTSCARRAAGHYGGRKPALLSHRG